MPIRTIPILPRSTGCDRDQLLDALDAAADDRDVVIEHGRERGGLLAQLREAVPQFVELHATTSRITVKILATTKPAGLDYTAISEIYVYGYPQ